MSAPLPHNTPLMIIAGPTASGKSALALDIARRTGASILSADSMQVYRGMRIGTAQPSDDDLSAVPHHLVGHVEPGEEYHVARFVAEADAIIAREHAAGRRVVVCGGTGLFLRHLIQGIVDGAPRDPDVRREMENVLAREGLEPLRERLRRVDPVREAEINANDAVRVMRALEVYEVTGRRMSELHADDVARRRERPHHYLVLNRPREELYARIEQRVDAMLASGWLDEAEALMRRGLPDSSQSCKALGYRELFAVLRGESELSDAAALIKTRTRQFARRQLTWFRGVATAEWIAPEDVVETALRRINASSADG